MPLKEDQINPSIVSSNIFKLILLVFKICFKILRIFLSNVNHRHFPTYLKTFSDQGLLLL